MDFNIGAALWFAAKGAGTIKSGQSATQTPYRTTCRIILSGQGADELCGGYTRHRNIFKSFGTATFAESLRLDTLRIWQRNLGRDDRILSDHGREARYPYLDEDFMLSILRTPVHEIANLNLPAGIGDKKCLRELASHLGLSVTARRVKKAIQFGSKASLYER
jgi:asparagine synthetase B (glutamine-hydrolysing)